jgi:hypothetical protein
MDSHHQRRFWVRGLAGLILALGLAGCAGQAVVPEGAKGWGRIESRTVTPDPECLARCERNYREALRICRDFYNSPDSGRYHDEVWRRQFLEQARMQYENCRSYCGR